MYTVEPNNARQLVEIAARDIEKLLSNRSKALVVSSACALSLSAIPVDCVLFKVLAGLEHFIWFTFSSRNRVQLMSSWNPCESQANR